MLLKITNNHFYDASYDSSLLRGIDDPKTPRPWQILDEIKKHASPKKKLLDIGCGTAFKLLPLSPDFNQIIGLDISASMLNAARDNVRKNKIENIQFVQSPAENMPFHDNSIDILTSMLARWDIKELSRVLKPNGIVIIEHVGCEDKKEFKMLFGKDGTGWRGQFLGYTQDEYLTILHHDFSQFFDDVKIQNGFWDTYYTADGIKQLLLNTPTIRNYDKKRDENTLNKAINDFSTENGIKLTQNRVLIHVKCPRIN